MHTLNTVNNKILWWGYRHIDGSLHAKRYFSEQDLDEARESPFVKRYSPAFPAQNREEALKILEDHLEED